MTKRVLVPIDGSDCAEEALEFALAEFSDDDVTVISVIDPIDVGYNSPVGVPGYSEEWYEQAQQNTEALFEDARSRADERGVSLSTATELGRPAQEIVEHADEHDFDQIVMGSHGRNGVSRILLGSVAETVVRRSPVPVTVVR